VLVSLIAVETAHDQSESSHRLRYYDQPESSQRLRYYGVLTTSVLGIQHKKDTVTGVPRGDIKGNNILLYSLGYALTMTNPTPTPKIPCIVPQGTGQKVQRVLDRVNI